MRTYSINNSLNGFYAHDGSGNSYVHPDAPMIRNRMRIANPTKRFVFIDDYAVKWEAAWAIGYAEPAWWDVIPARHGDGSTLSFADGHSEYWKWKGIETIKGLGTAVGGYRPERWAPETPEGLQDLYKIQRAVWGKLGYTPSY